MGWILYLDFPESVRATCCQDTTSSTPLLSPFQPSVYFLPLNVLRLIITFFSHSDLTLLSCPSSPSLFRPDQVLRLRTTWDYPSLPFIYLSQYTLGILLQHPARPPLGLQDPLWACPSTCSIDSHNYQVQSRLSLAYIPLHTQKILTNRFHFFVI